MRQAEERECVGQRYLVNVGVVAERGLVGNEEKQRVDDVVAQATPVWKSRFRVIASARPGIRFRHIKAQEFTPGDRDARENADVRVVRTERAERRDDVAGEPAVGIIERRGMVEFVFARKWHKRHVNGRDPRPVDVDESSRTNDLAGYGVDDLCGLPLCGDVEADLIARST